MNWIVTAFSAVAGMFSRNEHREDYQLFTAEMWKYTESLKEDHKSRIQELSELHRLQTERLTMQIQNITDHYESRIKAIVEDCERQLSEMRKTLHDVRESYESRLREIDAKYGVGASSV